MKVVIINTHNRIITTGRYEFNKVSTGHIIEWFLGVYTCMYIHTAVFSYKIITELKISKVFFIT